MNFLDSLTSYIDYYCERTAPGMWNEPLNAISNIAFFIASYFLFKKSLRKEIRFLAHMLWIVGLGSFLFHTQAQLWAMWSDVLPIAFFVLSFYYLFLKVNFNFSFLKITLAVIAYFAFTFVCKRTFDPFFWNGSQDYFSTFFLLVLMSLVQTIRERKSAWQYLACSGIFATSLFFRSIDSRICAAFPWGSHFVWHSLNGVLLYYLGVALNNDFKLQTTVQ